MEIDNKKLLEIKHDISQASELLFKIERDLNNLYVDAYTAIKKAPVSIIHGDRFEND